MKYALKQFFKLLMYSTLFWSFVFCLFILIRYYGRHQEQVNPVQLSKAISVTEYLWFGVILGVMVALVYTFIEFLFDKYLSKSLHLGFIILFKSIIYLLFLIFSLTFIAFLAEDYIDVDFPNERGWWISNRIFWLVTIYFIICSLVFSFIRLANDKFGKGVILNMLLGRYRKPREVYRIFMFLDLKSSTTHAENLGDIKYSNLIQDCFFYLNRIVKKHNAEIYQYVGDEAVLSWKLKKGINTAHCINLFFDFDKNLKRHTKYYKERYGIVPEFKAGIHAGKIIIAEVGTIKKELAYHGDVINTTARIQSQCNDYNESLLMSEELLDKLKFTRFYKSELIDNVLLKGKTEEYKIYAIHKTY